MEERDYYHKLFRQVTGNLIWFLAGLAVCGLITIGMHKCSPKEDVTRDTVTVVKVKVDTFFREKPVPVKEYIVRYARVAVKPDTMVEETAAEPPLTEQVVLPITQKEYKDSTYRAWVSGYEANLDSIEVYRRNVYTTQTITVRKKAPKVSLGIVGGYGYGLRSRQMEPFIGVGINWRFVPP